MRIPLSILAPFGITGIPTLTMGASNPEFKLIDSILNNWIHGYNDWRRNGGNATGHSDHSMDKFLVRLTIQSGASMAHCMHFKYSGPPQTHIIDYRIHGCDEEHECIVFVK